MKEIGVHAEAAISAAFAGRLILTAKDTARLLGIDVKTLSRMTNDRVIRAVRRGKLRAYTEADVREYLSEGPDINPAPKPVTNVKSFPRRRGRERLFT